MDHMSSPFLPTIHEEEEVLRQPQPRPHGDSHLPALPSSPSLTAEVHTSPPLQVDSALTTRGSPNSSSMKLLHRAERAGKSREKRTQISKSEVPVAKPARAATISLNQSEPAVGSVHSHADSELREGGARETPVGLPPINQRGGVISASMSSSKAANSSNRTHIPKLPLATDDLKQQSTHSKRDPEERPAEGGARTSTAKKEIEKPSRKGQVPVRLQSQSHITRQTAFRDAPQGYKEPGRRKRQKEAADTSVGGLEHKPQDAEV